MGPVNTSGVSVHACMFWLYYASLPHPLPPTQNLNLAHMIIGIVIVAFQITNVSSLLFHY